MAKDGKKKKKQKLIPKAVGGVKIPKPLRQTGEKVLRAAEQHPALADLAAAALLAAAAALRDNSPRGKAGHDEASGQVDEDTGASRRRKANPATLAIKTAALEAVREFATAYAERSGEKGGNGADPQRKPGR